MFVIFFFHNKNNVFGLSFHHLSTIFLLPLQVCVSTSVCFVKRVYLQLLVLPSATSFVCSQIHFGKSFFFYTMVNVPMKKVRLITMVDDLDFRIKAITFEAKVFNKCGTFDQLVNRNMEDLGYAYLHCDLLDRAALTTITLRVPYIEMHE